MPRLLVVLLSLMNMALPLNAATSEQAIPPQPGSVDDYIKNTEADIAAAPLLTLNAEILGIHVFNTRGALVSGQLVRGVGVDVVDPAGPAYEAGIRAPHVRKARAAAEAGLIALIFGGAMFFPPVIMVIPLMNPMEFREFDVILAVDAQRTHDVFEFQDSLRNIKPGELVYLTVLREGKREEIHVSAGS